MRFLFPFVFLFSGLLSAQSLTWNKVQQSPDYLKAKEAIAQYLPDRAIPRIQQLLSQEGLDQLARNSLRTLLGEAQLRSGRATDAVATLSHADLREFSPALLWLGHAYTKLSRFQDAIKIYGRIDRRSMSDDASLRIATLQMALGDTELASNRLTPLTESKDPDIAKEASFRLTDLALVSGNATQAEKILGNIVPVGPAEEGLVLYLKGQILLARGERVAAIGTFQTLVNTPIAELKLPSAVYHASTLALADSIALEGNYSEGITSLLETLERFPNSPRIHEIFHRLEDWAGKDPTTLPLLIEKLKNDWIPQPVANPNTFGMVDGSSAGSFALSSSGRSVSRRSIYALHLLATFNLQSKEPEYQALALIQFRQLQAITTAETNSLLTDSLIQIGMYHFKAENFDLALSNFKLLRDFSSSPHMKAFGSAFVGQASLALNDPAQASSAFLTARDLAVEANLEDLKIAATLNSAVALLATGNAKTVEEFGLGLADPEAKAFLLLERGLFLANRRDSRSRELLSRFLSEYPENPRYDEAALALAESALFIPRDPAMARSQAATLKFDLVKQPVLFARHALVLLELGTGVEQANEFLSKLPKHDLAPRILFQLGQSYRTGGELGKENAKIGPAYFSFEKFLKLYPDHELAEAAKFLGALSAMGTGTKSSEVDALARYSELAAGDGPLASEAQIARVSLLIDSGQQALGLSEIDRELKKNEIPDSDRYRLLILAADASGQLNDNSKALAYYDALLAMPKLPIAWGNRAQFHRGQIFERLGENGDALEAYLSVVNRDFDPEQASIIEWKWYDKCGIEGALALLEKAERWEAAVKLARRLARSGSPRAEDAAASAKRIELEQQIFQGP